MADELLDGQLPGDLADHRDVLFRQEEQMLLAAGDLVDDDMPDEFHESPQKILKIVAAVVQPVD